MPNNNKGSFIGIGPDGKFNTDMTDFIEFAYKAFDQLDFNGNGYLEWNELHAALKNPDLSDRERQFVQFLLENQKTIADSYDEGELQSSLQKGISRRDLNSYCTLIMNQLFS